jgi:hypothetical protein
LVLIDCEIVWFCITGCLSCLIGYNLQDIFLKLTMHENTLPLCKSSVELKKSQVCLTQAADASDGYALLKESEITS